MGGAWGDDPWRRYAYRWYDERGWTEHVSDGVNEALDQPGDRQVFAAPSAPSAPTGPVWIEQPSTVRVEPTPVTMSAVLGSSSPAPRRWPLMVLGMIASFALGGWIFSGGDDDQPVGVSSVEDAVDTTVLGIDDPADEPTPVLLPTTTENTVPVAPSLPAPVTLPVDPSAPAPVTIGTLPLPVSDAERAARNDGAIDPFEQATIDLIIAGFGMPAPTREELLAMGTTLCQAAAASPTMAELEAAIIGPMTSAALPPLQWGFLAGAAGGTLCLDELVRLGIVPAM